MSISAHAILLDTVVEAVGVQLGFSERPGKMIPQTIIPLIVGSQKRNEY
jgi:hypothetical protein